MGSSVLLLFSSLSDEPQAAKTVNAAAATNAVPQWRTRFL